MTLSCNTTGNLVPTVSWTKDGSPTISNSRISLSTDNKQLTIMNVNRTERGEYRCVADNDFGNETSNAVTLDVQCGLSNSFAVLYVSRRTSSDPLVLNLYLI